MTIIKDMDQAKNEKTINPQSKLLDFKLVY